MRPHVYFTHHPRSIKKKASELVECLKVDGPSSKIPCKTVEGVAKALYLGSVAEPLSSRTIALIARSIVAELFWVDKQSSMALQEELADLVTSNFITRWMTEFQRGCNHRHDDSLYPTFDDLVSQLEDVRFKQSNPRLGESDLEDLYLEELEITECANTPSATSSQSSVTQVPGPSSSEPDRTPTQSRMELPSDDACPEETLCLASVLLSDLYSVGFIHLDVMQTCILYLVDNLCLASDIRCLYVLFDRGATHLAPSLGLVFLRTCHYKIMLAGSTMPKDDINEIVELLTLIDDIISEDTMYRNNPSVASYAQRACHRWDSTIVGDISIKC
ncbi:hypothetical protein D9615_006234 [Tricholomella constricta]|uniref:Uncharacterized protein n=1 Tax=Tricholomella constricta TaxID=117010 RepID=A0A8H5HBS4_9AGAR|nr:hypothetical protein D9615_006234 [Tricholomella constricta]